MAHASVSCTCLLLLAATLLQTAHARVDRSVHQRFDSPLDLNVHEVQAILDTATDKANGPPTLDLGAVTNSTQQPCKCPSVQPMRTLSVRALASLQPDCPSAAPSSQRPPYGQDPSIIYYGSLYIAADVDVGQRVFVRVSPTLSTLYSRGWQVVYTEPGTLFYTEAPSIHSFHDPSCDCNRFLIYYSSITYNVISVIRSDSDNPLGPWTYMGTLDGVKGYDATLMVHPRGTYAMFSDFATLNIVPVANDRPWITLDWPSAIAAPDQPWEQLDGTRLVEAPAPFLAGTTVNVVYSSNRYCSPNYKCGMLRAYVSADPMDPASWMKNPEPVFESSPRHAAYGTGSGCFFKDAGGRVMWAYGGFNNPVGVSCDGPGRTVRMQEVSLLADGSVCLGVPRAYPGG